MILHVIIAAYQKAIGTRGLLDSLVLQTNGKWVAYVIHDGPPAEDFQIMKKLYDDQERIGFFDTDVRFGCYGHLNRKMMLESLSGGSEDFVLITNCDNYYVPFFVQMMMQEAHRDVGIVYCNTVHSHQNYDMQVSKLELSGIDMGAFIVRLSVAQHIGFKHIHYPAADGLYAEECRDYCRANNLRTVHINKPLFVHN
jgi:proteasome lid subunit RPN8/RPN11